MAKKDKKEDKQYDLVKVVTPRVSGSLLSITTFLCETSPFKNIFVPYLLKKNKFNDLFDFKLNHPVTPYPNQLHQPTEFTIKTYDPTSFLNDKDLVHFSDHLEQTPTHLNSILLFNKLYKEGVTTPLEVAKRFIELQKQSDQHSPPLKAFISINEEDVLEQAKQSTNRWANGTPISIVDGVPISTKDELDQAGYKTTSGTRFLERIAEISAVDARPVQMCREKGAVMIGKNNMHEIGISTLGYNTHFGFTRNPYNLNHYPGGSSSGSASSVASGLNPLSIGCDGGGSIRIPSSLCGIVGLKPTYGRVSHTGCFDLCYSVGHIGPMASNVIDAAIGYALMAGKDSHDDKSLIQPDPVVPIFSQIPQSKPLQGLKIGIYRDWFNDSTKDINDSCNRVLDLLVEQGATLVDIVIEKLLLIRLAQALIILSEMRNSMGKYMDKHKNEFHKDTRISLSLMDGITGNQYIHCTRIRTFAIDQLKEIFKSVDLIVTPTNGQLSPQILPSVVHAGESNLSEVAELMKYAFLGNITGIPSISVPVGVSSEKNLPIGIQFGSSWWNEDLLLYVAYVVEKNLGFNGKPQYYTPLLDNLGNNQPSSSSSVIPTNNN